MSEILINTTTRGLQRLPAIAAVDNTHFFAVWEDTSDRTIKGRIIQANGNVSGDEFIVNTPTPTEPNTDRTRPAIARSGSGPIVAWVEQALNPPGPRPHVKLQRFNQEGRKSGPEIQVSTSDIDPGHAPAVIGMLDGGFLVTWMDSQPEQRIRAQRFSGEGSKVGGEIQINTTQGFHEKPIATRLAKGNYVVAWRSDPSPPGGGALTFRIFDLEGQPVVDEIVPNLSRFTGEKAITFLDDGRFVIVHVISLGDSDIGVLKSGVRATVFEPDGTSANISIFADSEQGINSTSPAIAPLQSGRFLIAWVQKSAETFSTSPSVKARVFSGSQGEAVGLEVEVNTTTSDDRFSLCAATTMDLSEVAFFAWADSKQTDGAALGEVRGQVLPISASGGLG